MPVGVAPQESHGGAPRGSGTAPCSVLILVVVPLTPEATYERSTLKGACGDIRLLLVVTPVRIQSSVYVRGTVAIPITIRAD